MSAPLTPRDALAEVIKGHQVCCLRDFTEPDHLADAILASGLLAEAWDEGWEYGGAVGYRPKSDNPYRTERP